MKLCCLMTQCIMGNIFLSSHVLSHNSSETVDLKIKNMIHHAFASRRRRDRNVKKMLSWNMTVTHDQEVSWFKTMEFNT